MLDLIQYDYTVSEKVLGRAAADQLLGDWMKLLDTWKTGLTSGCGKALWNFGLNHSIGRAPAALPYNAALPNNMRLQIQYALFAKDLADGMIEDIQNGLDKMAGINYQVLKQSSPPSTPPVDPSQPKAPATGEVKTPKIRPRDNPGTVILGLSALALMGFGIYKLGVLEGWWGSGSVDCDYWWNASKCIGPDWANEGYRYSVPKTCGCVPGTTPAGYGISDGTEMIYCDGCPHP